jgi:hypothetical protein
MTATVPTEFVVRVLQATPAQRVSMWRFLEGGVPLPGGGAAQAPDTDGVPMCPNMAGCFRAVLVGGQTRCGERGLACVVAAKAKQPSLERREKLWEEEVEASNVYRLRLGHKAWTLVIQGKRDVLGDERAVHLVDYLLKNPPDEAIHGSVLENCVDGSPRAFGWQLEKAHRDGGKEIARQESAEMLV